MKPLTEKGHEPYYNLIFSKKVIKNGFQELEKEHILFGGPKNIPTKSKNYQIITLKKTSFEVVMMLHLYCLAKKITKMLDEFLFSFPKSLIGFILNHNKFKDQWMYNIPTVFANEYLSGMIYADGHTCVRRVEAY